MKNYLPCSLTSISIKASVVDMFASVTLSQMFSNENADTAYEALYRFPLYESSAVCGFEMEHSGRRIRGIVKPEEDAMKTYETAKAQGKTAALVLQKEADIFQTKVGNIPPKTSITVTLTYITPLKRDTESNAVRITLPTSIAPRYGVPTHPGSTNVNKSQTGFELTLDAMMPSQITSISSPSHPIAMTLSGANTASVTLSNRSPFLNMDVVILIAANDLDTPRCMIETHPTESTKCAMLTLAPKFNLPRVPTEVIFVIDRSGSMYDKVETVRRALQIFLKSLPASPEIYFNICSFGSRFDYLFRDGKSKRYDSQTLKSAEDYVPKVDADYGGTEILDPLLDCMKRRRTDCQTSIILLTDGEVFNTESIINSISQEKAKHLDKPLRVFSLGIGDSVSHHLVEGIARAGGGYSQLVLKEERLDRKVVRMLSAGLQPPLNNLHVDWPGKPPIEETMYRVVKSDVTEDFEVVKKPEKQSATFFDTEADDTDAMRTEPAPDPPRCTLKAPAIQQFPETIPSIYSSSMYIMFFLFPSSHPTPKKITLEGTTPTGSVMSLDIPITEYTLDDNLKPILHTLAARTILGELQEGRLEVQRTQGDDPSLPDAVKHEGIRIGVKYCLVSKWTGFVAVDEFHDSDDLGGIVDDEIQQEGWRSRSRGIVDEILQDGYRSGSGLRLRSGPDGPQLHGMSAAGKFAKLEPKLSDEQRLHQIIMHQSSSGAFPSNTALARLLHLPDIPSIPVNIRGIPAEIWMTVIVCVFFERKLACEKEAWELVVEKAWAFVSSHASADKVSDLTTAAEGLFIK